MVSVPDWVEVVKKGEELLGKVIREGEVVLFKDACSCETEEDFNDGLLVLTNRNIIFIQRDSLEPRYEVGLHAPIENVNYVTYTGIFYQMIEIEVNVDGQAKLFKFMDFLSHMEGEKKVSEITDEIQKIIESHKNE